MRLLALAVAVTALCGPHALRAQQTPDSTRAAASPRWTAQEVSDACLHKPGARMRFYGCRRSAYLPGIGEPLYIVDGEQLAADTAGLHLAGEARVAALRPEDILELTVVSRDSALARYGPAARFGAVIIRTKSAAPRPVPSANGPRGV